MYILMALAVIVLCICFFGGSEPVNYNGEDFSDPHVSVLLYFVYFEIAIAALVTLWSAASSFAVKMKTNSKQAIIGLVGVAVIILLMIITYAIGDGTKMNIIGYEGTDNEGTWSKIADMFLMTSYVLAFIATLSLIASPIIKKLK